MMELWERRGTSPVSESWKADTNSALFDRFSVGHAAIGMWLGAGGVGIIPAIAYHTLFEVFENYVAKKYMPDLFPDPTADSLVNIVGDTIAMGLGWALNLKDTVKEDPWVGKWQLTTLLKMRS